MSAKVNVATIWSRAVAAVRSQRDWQTWSAAKGNLPTKFKAWVSGDTIYVSSEGTSSPRQLVRGTFEKLAGDWDGYIAGRVQRGALRVHSHHTSYALAIMNKIENG